MFLKPDYKEDLFKGTANFYAQYRIPYPESLITGLIKNIGYENNDALLDLACGPGRLTIPLAKYFKEIIAVDQEKEMISKGKKIAGQLNIKKIHWLLGKAEEFTGEPDSFNLITIGDAFHRLDQFTVLQNSFRVLRNGGYLAVIGSNSITTGSRHWQNELTNILYKDQKPNNENINYERQFETALKEFGFKDVVSCSFKEKQNLTIKEIMGYLYSMSVFSKNAIGNDNGAFEKTITDNLLKIKPDNVFEFDFECGYHIGRKP